MTRLFSVLAWFAVLAVVANMAIGLAIGDLREAPTDQTLSLTRLHRLFGVAAALAVVFVNSIVVTYFVGTSRWCKEVSEAYKLDQRYVRRAAALKRQTFPWCVLAMLTAVCIVALGGAADPATGMPNTDRWVTPHLFGALTGLAVIVYAGLVQWNRIHENHGLIGAVMDDVRSIRQERGLDV